MTRLKVHTAFFISGIVAVAAILVLLMAVGVLPVKTERTTVVEQQVTGTTMATTALTSGTLTPAQIYQKYAQGVVEIIATFSSAGQSAYGPFGGTQTQKALGSGFVVSKDGYILTNAHVVSDTGQTVKTVEVIFKTTGSQTKRVTGTVVGADNTSDVALIKVDPAKAGTLDPIPLGDSSTVQPGEAVVAIGNPLGYDFSITEGIVSATNRNLQSPNGSIIANGIQTDAAINEGNSGGPLIDSSGKVIGINEQIASQSGGNQGLGFAVPIDSAANVIDQLKKTGTVTYAWLGIEGQTISPDIAKALGLKTSAGVLVANVTAGSPAAAAGIKGGSKQQALQGQVYVVGGDIITALDGQALTSMEQLAAAIAAHKPGDQVALTVVRGASTGTVKVALSQRPDSP
jgi:S1-C subfamily serine protease